MHPHRVVMDVLSALSRLGRCPHHGECRGFVVMSTCFLFFSIFLERTNKCEYIYKPLNQSESFCHEHMYRSSYPVHQLRPFTKINKDVT